MSDISEDNKTAQDKGSSNDKEELDAKQLWHWVPRITFLSECCMLVVAPLTTLFIATSWPDDSPLFDFLGAVCTALIVIFLISRHRLESLMGRWREAREHPEESAGIKPLWPISFSLILYFAAIAAGIAVAELPVLVASFSPMLAIWDPALAEIYSTSDINSMTGYGVPLAALYFAAISVCRSHLHVPAARVLYWLAVSAFLIVIAGIVWISFGNAARIYYCNFPVTFLLPAVAFAAMVYALALGKFDSVGEFEKSAKEKEYRTVRIITIALMCAIIFRHVLFPAVTVLHNLSWSTYLKILLPKMIFLFDIVAVFLGVEVFYPFWKMTKTHKQGKISAEQFLCRKLGWKEDRELSDADIAALWLSDAWQDPIVLMLIFAFLVVSGALVCSPSGNWGILVWIAYAIICLRWYWQFSCYDILPIRTFAMLIYTPILTAISLQFLSHGMIADAALLPLFAAGLLSQWRKGKGREKHNRSYVELCLAAIGTLSFFALMHTGFSAKRIVFVLLCFAMASAALWMTAHDDRQEADVPIVDGRASGMNLMRFSIATVFCLLMVFLNTAGSMSPIMQEVIGPYSNYVSVAYPETDLWETKVVSRRYASSDSLLNDQDSALNFSSQNDLRGDHITVWVVYDDGTTATADCWMDDNEEPWLWWGV